MHHIELAVSILKRELRSLEIELQQGSRDPGPNDDVEIPRKIQQLKISIKEIREKFNA